MENKSIFRFWVNHSMRDFHVTLGVAAVVIQIIGRLAKHSELFAVSDIVALFAILHFFIHGYFYRQYKFLTDNQRVYSLPKKKIAKTGAEFLGVFLLAASVGMAVVKELYSGTLLEKLKAMILYILRGIFGALLGTDGLGTDDLLHKDNSNLLGVMNQVAVKSESPWEKVINGIQTILIIVGVASLIILIIALIVNYIRRLIGNVKTENARAKGYEVRDREERIRTAGGKREKFLDFSPDAKIRKTYRRTVNRKRRRKEVVPEWLTPAEIEAMVVLPEDEPHLELHRMYEKARYSEKGCTEEDVKRVKLLKV